MPCECLVQISRIPDIVTDSSDQKRDLYSSNPIQDNRGSIMVWGYRLDWCLHGNGAIRLVIHVLQSNSRHHSMWLVSNRRWSSHDVLIHLRCWTWWYTLALWLFLAICSPYWESNAVQFMNHPSDYVVQWSPSIVLYV